MHQGLTTSASIWPTLEKPEADVPSLDCILGRPATVMAYYSLLMGYRTRREACQPNGERKSLAWAHDVREQASTCPRALAFGRGHRRCQDNGEVGKGGKHWLIPVSGRHKLRGKWLRCASFAPANQQQESGLTPPTQFEVQGT